jgi:hypothetical protein
VANSFEQVVGVVSRGRDAKQKKKEEPKKKYADGVPKQSTQQNPEKKRKEGGEELAKGLLVNRWRFGGGNTLGGEAVT